MRHDYCSTAGHEEVPAFRTSWPPLCRGCYDAERTGAGAGSDRQAAKVRELYRMGLLGAYVPPAEVLNPRPAGRRVGPSVRRYTDDCGAAWSEIERREQHQAVFGSDRRGVVRCMTHGTHPSDCPDRHCHVHAAGFPDDETAMAAEPCSPNCEGGRERVAFYYA